MAMNALLRAEGNARVPMVAMVIGAVSNIILDAVFIIPLQMGIKGAAIATVIAQVFSVIYTMFYYFSGNSFLKIKLRNLKLDFGTIKEIFTIGVASFGRTIGGSLSMVFVNRMLASYGGDYAVSTFGVVNRIMMFAIMPGIVIGQGLQPILGFNYGAQRYDRALKVIKLALIAATISSVIVFAVLYIVPGPVIRIFTGDNELIGQASYAARRIFIGISLIGAMMVGSTVFQAIGKATQSFVTSIARGVLFLFPLVFTLPRFWGTDGVWISFPIADALSLILTLSLFIPQVKKMSELNKHSREISEPQVQT
jgi:Na+-driven multidrug efflux pump